MFALEWKVCLLTLLYEQRMKNNLINSQTFYKFELCELFHLFIYFNIFKEIKYSLRKLQLHISCTLHLFWMNYPLKRCVLILLSILCIVSDLFTSCKVCVCVMSLMSCSCNTWISVCHMPFILKIPDRKLLSLVPSHVTFVPSVFTILPPHNTPSQQHTITPPCPCCLHTMGLWCQRRAAPAHLLHSTEPVYGSNDDEEEEIQVQGGFRAGRAVVGSLRQRGPLLQSATAGRRLLRGVLPVIQPQLPGPVN